MLVVRQRKLVKGQDWKMIEMPRKGYKDCPFHWLPAQEGERLPCLGCVAGINPDDVRKLRGAIPIVKLKEAEK